MVFEGPRFHGKLPCMLCQHWKRRKSPAEWRALCGACRDLSEEELTFLYWVQEEDGVVVAPNMLRHSRANSRARYVAARAVLDAAALPPRSRILDIGCGVAAFAALFRDFAYVGADLQPSRLRRGRATQPWAGFSAQDVTQLACREGAFDAVLCLEVIEHVPPAARRAMLTELFRVLRRGGLLILSTPDGRITGWKRILGRRCERSHEAELPAEEVGTLVQEAGGQLLRATVVDNLVVPAGRTWTALLQLTADRPPLRHTVQSLSERAGYATKLYVAKGPTAGSESSPHVSASHA